MRLPQVGHSPSLQRIHRRELWNTGVVVSTTGLRDTQWSEEWTPPPREVYGMWGPEDLVGSRTTLFVVTNPRTDPSGPVTSVLSYPRPLVGTTVVGSGQPSWYHRNAPCRVRYRTPRAGTPKGDTERSGVPGEEGPGPTVPSRRPPPAV